MSFFDASFMILPTSSFVVAILYVVFGEITVRRLRKNPETKEALGLDFVGGRDIVSVAIALSVPRRLNRKARRSKIYFMFADADVLYQYTNPVDRVLARLFTSLFVFTGVGLLLISIFRHFNLI